MLTGITTRASTPHEDAELWPSGSARPVMAWLAGTLAMTGADARDLLTAARTAQAKARQTRWSATQSPAQTPAC